MLVNFDNNYVIEWTCLRNNKVLIINWIKCVILSKIIQCTLVTNYDHSYIFTLIMSYKETESSLDIDEKISLHA